MATEITKEEWVANGAGILDRAFTGEEFVITDGGRPRFRLCKLSEEERIEIEREMSTRLSQRPATPGPPRAPPPPRGAPPTGA